VLEQKDLQLYEEDALNYNYFNKQLFAAIEPLIVSPVINLAFPDWLQSAASLGTIIHLPLYGVVSAFVARKTKNTVFYDSVLFGVLFFVYGLFLCWFAWMIWMFTHHWMATVFWTLLLPLLAYAAVLKKINDRAKRVD